MSHNDTRTCTLDRSSSYSLCTCIIRMFRFIILISWLSGNGEGSGMETEILGLPEVVFFIIVAIIGALALLLCLLTMLILICCCYSKRRRSMWAKKGKWLTYTTYMYMYTIGLIMPSIQYVQYIQINVNNYTIIIIIYNNACSIIVYKFVLLFYLYYCLFNY